jgi:hypothetical protein
MKNLRGLALVISLTVSANGFAQTGADILLNEVSGGKSTIKIEPAKPAPSIEQIKPRTFTQVKVNLDNPVHRSLFTLLETQTEVPFDVRKWADSIFLEDYAQELQEWQYSTSVNGWVLKGDSILRANNAPPTTSTTLKK